MTAALPDDRVQLRASPGGRDEAHQAIEAAIEVVLVDLQRAVRERLAASPDGAGAFQQALQSRRENVIAGIDRVLDVADQRREADLVPQPGPAHLAATAAISGSSGFWPTRAWGALWAGGSGAAVGAGSSMPPGLRGADPGPAARASACGRRCEAARGDPPRPRSLRKVWARL